jgi:hypothetical protein
MIAKMDEKDVYVKFISEDEAYALVSLDLEGKSKMFKVDLVNISGLGKRNINKLKNLKKGSLD